MKRLIKKTAIAFPNTYYEIIKLLNGRTEVVLSPSQSNALLTIMKKEIPNLHTENLQYYVDEYEIKAVQNNCISIQKTKKA